MRPARGRDDEERGGEGEGGGAGNAGGYNGVQRTILPKNRRTQHNHLADEGLPTWNLRKEKTTKADGWHVVNFEYLLRHPDVADEWWDAVVVDESTRIRNPKAKTTKIFMHGFQGVRTRMILSGCPAPESPLEYGPQFLFLVRNIVGLRNHWAFRNELFNPSGYGGYTWVPKRGAPDLIRKFVAEHSVVLKRQDAGVGGKKVYETRLVEPTKDQDALMNEVVDQWSVDGDSTQWAVVVSTWLARLAGGFHPKTGDTVSDGRAQELAELMTGELAGQQAIVFFRFNDEITLCERVLKEWGVECDYITGETPVEDREEVRLIVRDLDGKLIDWKINGFQATKSKV